MIKGDSKKLKLTWIPWKDASCIQHPHYDLHTKDFNVACILTDQEGARLIRKWIKEYNKKL